MTSSESNERPRHRREMQAGPDITREGESIMQVRGIPAVESRSSHPLLVHLLVVAARRFHRSRSLHESVDGGRIAREERTRKQSLCSSQFLLLLHSTSLTRSMNSRCSSRFVASRKLRRNSREYCDSRFPISCESITVSSTLSWKKSKRVPGMNTQCKSPSPGGEMTRIKSMLPHRCRRLV